MKQISKSKCQLAQLLIKAGVTQFPDGTNWAWYGNKTASGYFGEFKPEYNKETKTMDAISFDPLEKFKCQKIPNWHQTVLSRDEFNQIVAETAPDADGWIEWGGGECQIEDCEVVQVKYREDDGSGMCAIEAGELYWGHQGKDFDIIAYRLHKPELSKSTAVGDDETNLAAKEEIEALEAAESPEQCAKLARIYAPTLDQLLQDWRNADDYAQRKQAEADEAAAMRDERWKAVQDRAVEFNVTVGWCKDAVSEHELVADSVAWDDLLEGDEMLCVVAFGGSVNDGSAGIVRYKAEDRIVIDFPEQRDYVYYKSHFERGDVKFIRRP